MFGGQGNRAIEESAHEMIPIVVISLKRADVRCGRISQRLRGLGVTYEIFDAIDGRELSSKEKNRAVNRFSFWCRVGRPVLDGEIGCALSHVRVYKRFLEEQTRVGIDNIPCICILEDDAILTDRFKESLAGVERMITKTRSCSVEQP